MGIGLAFPSRTRYPSPNTYPGTAPNLYRDITLTLTTDPCPYLLRLDDTMPRTIRVTLGDIAYATAVLTEVTGLPLAGTALTVGLWPSTTTPGTMVTPDVTEAVTASSSRVKLLVGTGHYAATPGKYYVAVRAVDSPETEVVFSSDKVTIV